MKIRMDFVTNSSSSSFILSFKTEEDYNDFKNICDVFEYRKFYNIVKSHIRTSDIEDERKKSEELLNLYYSDKYHSIILKEKFGDKYIDNYSYEDSEEYNNRLKEFLSNDNEYNDKIDKIHNSKIIVDIMIWDTDGGITEWAIRNGFIESVFSEYSILVWNVG